MKKLIIFLSLIFTLNLNCLVKEVNDTLGDFLAEFSNQADFQNKITAQIEATNINQLAEIINSISNYYLTATSDNSEINKLVRSLFDQNFIPLINAIKKFKDNLDKIKSDYAGLNLTYQEIKRAGKEKSDPALLEAQLKRATDLEREFRQINQYLPAVKELGDLKAKLNGLKRDLERLLRTNPKNRVLISINIIINIIDKLIPDFINNYNILFNRAKADFKFNQIIKDLTLTEEEQIRLAIAASEREAQALAARERAKPAKPAPAVKPIGAAAAQPEKKVIKPEIKLAQEKKEEAELEDYKPKQTRALFILLDDSEITSEQTALTSATVDVIKQKPGAILTTETLLSNVFRGVFKKNVIGDVIEEFRTNFDPADWIMKKVDNNGKLILLIPKEYLAKISGENINNVSKAASKKEKTENITALEKQLGLKINHMDDIEELYFNELRYLRSKLYGYNTIMAKEPKSSKIFLNLIKQNKILLRSVDNINLNWVLWLTGHGSYGRTIADMKLDEFTDLVDNYISKKIKTKFFGYDSCYAAGFNATQIYGELTSKLNKTYPFPILTVATTDTPTRGGLTIQYQGHSTSGFKYDQIAQAFNEESIDYAKLFNAMYVWRSMVPLVRPPYVPTWIPLVSAREAIISISQTFASTRNPNKSLIINPAFDNSGKPIIPLAILLYSPVIPFEIDLSRVSNLILKPEDQTARTRFISMQPGKAIHLFQSITAKLKLEIIIKMFIVDYGIEKTIWIKNLQAENGNYKDVIIDILKEEAKIYYTNDKGEPITAKLDDKNINIIDNKNNYLKTYNDLLESEPYKTILKNFNTLQAAAKEIEKVYEKREGPKGAAKPANLNQQLLLAAKNNNSNSLRNALESGANINAQDKLGRSALHWTVLNNQPATAKFLILNRANTNLQDANGQTPLHLAAIYSDPDIVKLVLTFKLTDPNIQDRNGNTPLHLTTDRNPAIFSDFGLIENLKVNLNIKNQAGFTIEDLVKKDHFLQQFFDILKSKRQAAARMAELDKERARLFKL